MKGYEWYEWYKEPSECVQFNQEYLDGFWKFIYDRLEIYYKRVVLKHQFPWTLDIIFNEYRFTNISRDMDKLTIFERNNILCMVDKPTDNLLLRKKSVLFNIVLFRIFVKEESYNSVGFIDFENPDWKNTWESGKNALISRRAKGLRNFTGSFMVNTMKICNQDESTRDNQTINALCLLDSILDNFEEFYYNTVTKPLNMKEQLEYLRTIDGIGHFTAYEIACSIAMIGRYFNNALVSWSQDSYTSVGQGSRGGIHWVYKSIGNLSDIESIIYLRSIWKHEMIRVGLYESFIKMLPKVFNGELDLRIIEHCLCESHKYYKIKTKTGRTKQRFSIGTTLELIDDLEV